MPSELGLPKHQRDCGEVRAIAFRCPTIGVGPSGGCRGITDEGWVLCEDDPSTSVVLISDFMKVAGSGR